MMDTCHLLEQFRGKRFFGRVEELNVLKNAINNSFGRGFFNPTFISGMHGAGKSALVYESLIQNGINEENIYYIDFRRHTGSTDDQILESVSIAINKGVELENSHKNALDQFLFAIKLLKKTDVLIFDELERLHLTNNKESAVHFLQALWKIGTSPGAPRIMVITSHNWVELEADAVRTSGALSSAPNFCLGLLDSKSAEKLLKNSLELKNDQVDIEQCLFLAGGYPALIEKVAKSVTDLGDDCADSELLFNKVYKDSSKLFRSIWNSLEIREQLILAGRAIPESKIEISHAQEDRVNRLISFGLLSEDGSALFSCLFAYWIARNHAELFEERSEVIAERSKLPISTVEDILGVLANGAEAAKNVWGLFS